VSFLEFAPGQVTSATLDVNFGEFPLGTPSPFYGSARISIQGTIAGLDFTAGLDPNGTPVDILYSRDNGTFGEGAVSGPNTEFAVFRFQTSIGSAPVQGAVLLKAQ